METHLAARQVLLAGATPGIEAARELSKLTDEAVRELARAASSHVHGRLAIVALGGWGAGALLPGSDLDILVLADGPSSRVKPFVEAVLYPLWDSGLAVGHQVRSPKEQLRAMREDFVTCTAALTARPLAGDLEWAARHVGECARDAHKRSRELLAALVARPRPGSCYLLEPDLKEGAGGRRDYDELTWTAAVLTGIPQHDPSALVDRGLLLPEEFERLTVHAETLATARWILAREGYGNLLSLDALDVVPDELAQATQLALAETALILGAARRRLAGQPDPGSGHVTSGQVHEWLDQGLDGLSAIEQAAQSGRLEELAPGFRELMTVRRPGLGHQLTVGAHSLRAAALLDSLRSDPVLARSAAATPSLPALQVAAIAHDVGKIDGGADHPQRGAAPAHDIAARFGLDERWASHVSELVRLHLALAEMATHVDLDDEDSVLSAAARIGDRGLLGPLHLLTAADSLATGPATWSSWKASLVGTLVSRIDAALSDEVDGAGIAGRAEAVRAEALTALADSDTVECAFARRAPLRYLAAHSSAEVVRDARLVAELTRSGGGADGRVAVSPGPAEGTHALTIVSHDRPELLARIAGALALAGLDILSVDAYGAPGHIALDRFVVRSATLRPATTETFASFERLLGAALRDRLELKTRLSERRRHYPAKSTAPVKVRVGSAGYDTAVRVSAPDRPGLLHDLAQAVSATGLDIRRAKVLTVDGMAIDTFHVVDSVGSPVTDDGVIGHLVMRMREIR